jgi:hypothetical protein
MSGARTAFPSSPPILDMSGKLKFLIGPPHVGPALTSIFLVGHFQCSHQPTKVQRAPDTCETPIFSKPLPIDGQWVQHGPHLFWRDSTTSLRCSSLAWLSWRSSRHTVTRWNMCGTLTKLTPYNVHTTTNVWRKFQHHTTTLHISTQNRARKIGWLESQNHPNKTHTAQIQWLWKQPCCCVCMC